MSVINAAIKGVSTSDGLDLGLVIRVDVDGAQKPS